MLKDPKAHALVENFAGQWLLIRNLKSATPDPALFPTFDETLRSAMLKETELYFENVMREDRSILEFIDSDYTFVNERLAKHYGIDGVQGERLPPRVADGRPARRRADAGQHPDRDLQPDADLAGEARQVDPGKHPGHAAAAAAARRAAD